MDELEVTKMSLNLANGLIKVLTERITHRDNIIKELRKKSGN